MRDWIKALPLGLGLPVVIGAASVKPEDAASNIAAWLHLIGVEHAPDWLSAPGVDNRVILGSLSLGVIYALLVWGVPALRRGQAETKAGPLSVIRDFQEGRWQPTYPPARPAVSLTWEDDVVLRELSIVRLREYTRSLASAVRAFASNFVRAEQEHWYNRRDHLDSFQREREELAHFQRVTQFLHQYREQYGTKAAMLYDELLRRKGIFSRPVSSGQNMALLQPEHPGNPTTIIAGANTLERLVEELRG